jgi:hypothetical protein
MILVVEEVLWKEKKCERKERWKLEVKVGHTIL